MADIHIEKKHNRGKEGARLAVENVAREIRTNLQIEYLWDGDTLKFHRPGAEGTITVAEDLVTVDIKLGMLLGAFSGMVDQQVRGYLEKELGEG